jgi:uncharacterized protein
MTAVPSAAPTERLHGAVVPYWILGDLLWTAVLTGLAWFVGRPALQKHWPWWNATYEAVLAGLCILLLVLAVALPLLSYQRWRYGFAGNLLRMRYGILFVEERAVPVQRMQHVDLLRGPIERLFGLATLIVYTAGNEGSAFRVPGLAAPLAQQLRDRIVEARGDGRL